MSVTVMCVHGRCVYIFCPDPEKELIECLWKNKSVQKLLIIPAYFALHFFNVDLAMTINFSFQATNIMAKIQTKLLMCCQYRKDLLVSALKLLSFLILKIFCSHEVASHQQSWLLVNMGEVIPAYSAQS